MPRRYFVALFLVVASFTFVDKVRAQEPPEILNQGPAGNPLNTAPRDFGGCVAYYGDPSTWSSDQSYYDLCMTFYRSFMNSMNQVIGITFGTGVFSGPILSGLADIDAFQINP